MGAKHQAGGSYEEGYRRSLQERYDLWKTFWGQPIHEHYRKELSSVECSSHHIWCPQPTPSVTPPRNRPANRTNDDRPAKICKDMCRIYIYTYIYYIYIILVSLHSGSQCFTSRMSTLVVPVPDTIHSYITQHCVCRYCAACGHQVISRHKVDITNIASSQSGFLHIIVILISFTGQTV